MLSVIYSQFSSFSMLALPSLQPSSSILLSYIFLLYISFVEMSLKPSSQGCSSLFLLHSLGLYFSRFVSVWCSFSQTDHCKMNVCSSPPSSVKMFMSKFLTTKISLPHVHHSLHSHTYQWYIKSFLTRYLLCECVNLSSPLLYIPILFFFSSPKNRGKNKIVCRCHYLSRPRSLIFSCSFWLSVAGTFRRQCVSKTISQSQMLVLVHMGVTPLLGTQSNCHTILLFLRSKENCNNSLL